MSRLDIVGRPPPGESGDYRGVDRWETLPEPTAATEPEAYELFLWFMSQGDGEIPPADAAKLFRLVDLYRRLAPELELEVIEVSAPEETPMDGEFLGFDVAAESYSLLLDRLEVREPRRTPSPDDPYLELRPALDAIKRHFRSHLGPHGLFPDPVVAADCLSILLAFQSMRPGLLEDASVTFSVVRVVLSRP